MELSEMAGAFDREIERTIRENGLALERFEGEEKRALIDRLFDQFVFRDEAEGPNWLWEELKYCSEEVDCRGEDPYFHLLEAIDRERVLYLFVETRYDRKRDFFVFRGRMEDIHTFVGDCLGLDEYHLMTTDGEELFCATHHDQLFHVDARRSPRNEEGRRRWEKRAEERRRKIEEAREILARFEKSQDAGNSA